MKLYVLVAISVFITLSSCEPAKQKLHNKIKNEEQKLFSDQVVSPQEDSLVKILIADYETFSKENPDDTLAIEYLYRSADLCKNTMRYKQAIDTWNKLIQKYPNSSRASYSLFMQAFTYETNLNDTSMAKKLYNNFIEKYPSHKLVPSAKASVEQMGIPLNDLIKKFEEQNKEKNQKANS
jgi:outer membrane protein assembly factor BamD (BamD/ComL family)